MYDFLHQIKNGGNIPPWIDCYKILLKGIGKCYLFYLFTIIYMECMGHALEVSVKNIHFLSCKIVIKHIVLYP